MASERARIAGLTRRSLLAGGAALTLVAAVGAASAQSFPTGPVKIVTSVGAGAAPDVISRLLADYLTRHWGQQVIVMNQPGGAGAVAIKAVAPAPPDGHTLYMSLASNFIALPELQKNFPVDVVRDFVPIGFVGAHPLIVAAAPALGVNTLAELIELLKRRPGEINVAAGNRGSIIHLAAEWLRSATGTRFTIVHYAGGAQALPDVIGGRVQADDRRHPKHPGSGRQRPGQALGGHQQAAARQFPADSGGGRDHPRLRGDGLDGADGAARHAAGDRAKISDDVRTVQAQPELQKRVDGARQLHPPDHARRTHRLHPRTASRSGGR